MGGILDLTQFEKMNFLQKNCLNFVQPFGVTLVAKEYSKEPISIATDNL